MRFSLLLFALGWILKWASRFNADFKRHIRKTSVRILIKTSDGKRARLFAFHEGTVSTVPGDQEDFDAALVWKDAATGFSVMTDKRPDAAFNAAAAGQFRVEGMSVYAQWFDDGIKLVL